MNEKPQTPPEAQKGLIAAGSAAEERVRLANQEEGRVAHEAKAAPNRRSLRFGFVDALGSLFKGRQK